MTKPIDLTGKKLGKLTALYFTGFSRKNHGRIWRFYCDCGNETEMSVGMFNSESIISCGCVRDEKIRALGMTTFKHGEGHGNKTKEYRAWCSMKERCLNTSHPSYLGYGGRGIEICERWKNDYSAFLLDMGRAEEGFSLDRIDVNGNYEPSNCRWADNVTQSRNRRNTKLIDVFDKKIIATELAEKIGVHRNDIYVYERVKKLIEEKYGIS